MNEQLPQSVTDVPLDEIAASNIEEHVIRVAEQITVQAKVLAFREKATRALNTHVSDAIYMLKKKDSNEFRKDILILIGGALVGAFVQGLVTALTNENFLELAIYSIIGPVGFGLSIYALNQNK